MNLEFWNSSGVKGSELGIIQGYNYEKHASSIGGVRILNGISLLAKKLASKTTLSACFEVNKVIGTGTIDHLPLHIKVCNQGS